MVNNKSGNNATPVPIGHGQVGSGGGGGDREWKPSNSGFGKEK